MADDGLWEVAVRNRFNAGDTIEVLTPSGSTIYQLEAIFNHKREQTDVAPGDGHIVYIKVPLCPEKAKMAILTRKFTHGENTRNPIKA